MSDGKITRESHGLVTAKDVANEAGVSLTTVSRCYNEADAVSTKTLDRVLSVADQLGFRPNIAARLLASRRSNLIGLLVNDFEDPEILDLFRHVSSEAQYRRHHAILLNSSKDKDRVNSIGSGMLTQVDGLLVSASDLPEEIVARCKAQNKPVVIVGRKSQRPEYSSVYCDNESGAAQVADYFEANGVQRPAFIGGPTDATVVMERMEGFVRRIEQLYGVQPITRTVSGGDYDAGRSVTEELMALPKPPDGFFCSNDLLAVGTKDALAKLSKTENITVVGFGCSMLSRLEAYQLQSVGLPFEKMVRTATSHLIKQICAEVPAASEIRFPCEFMNS